MHILSDAQAAALREALSQVSTILDSASFVTLEGNTVVRTKAVQTVQVSDTPKSQPKTRVSRRKRGKQALDATKAAKIKELLAAGKSATSIAREFGVHPTTINCIKYGKTWKHVTVAKPAEVVLTA